HSHAGFDGVSPQYWVADRGKLRPIPVVSIRLLRASIGSLGFFSGDGSACGTEMADCLSHTRFDCSDQPERWWEVAESSLEAVSARCRSWRRNERHAEPNE